MSKFNLTKPLPEISNEMEEGKDYINISRYSSTKLGKMLAPGYGVKINTVFGEVGNIRAGMDYVVTEEYPYELLKKKKLTRAELRSIPKRKKNIPNYWAINAYLLIMRIRQDEELIELIKENTGFYTSLRVLKNKEFLGSKATIISDIKDMNKYVNIISYLDQLVKDDLIFDDVVVNQFIEDCREVVDKHNIFYGSTVNVKLSAPKFEA